MISSLKLWSNHKVNGFYCTDNSFSLQNTPLASQKWILKEFSPKHFFWVKINPALCGAHVPEQVLIFTTCQNRHDYCACEFQAKHANCTFHFHHHLAISFLCNFSLSFSLLFHFLLFLHLNQYLFKWWYNYSIIHDLGLFKKIVLLREM